MYITVDFNMNYLLYLSKNLYTTIHYPTQCNSQSVKFLQEAQCRLSLLKMRAVLNLLRLLYNFLKLFFPSLKLSNQSLQL